VGGETVGGGECGWGGWSEGDYTEYIHVHVYIIVITNTYFDRWISIRRTDFTECPITSGLHYRGCHEDSTDK